MEDVYVIKVKTKPTLATLYPSERRYSASTVGGLSLVHAILGTLSLLLGIISKSAQGIVLFVCCLAPLGSGILAWKKWYIDRNIGIFFYCCIFSAAVSVSCLIAAVYEVSVLTEKVVMGRSVNEISLNQTAYTEFDDSTSETTLPGFTTLDLSTENSSSFDNNYNADQSDMVGNDQLLFLTLNVAIACLLEFGWSLLCLKIGLKGMRKEFSEDRRNKKGDKQMKAATTLSSRPDIILMNKHICCSMQSLDSLQSLQVQNFCPKLPLPESNKEFKERVEQFLTNQVHHRTISDGI